MQAAIQQDLTELGYHVRAVSYSHVKEIQDTIESLYQTKSIAQDVYDEVMEYVSFEVPKEMPEPKSVIILAIGNPANLNLVFQWKGGEVKTCLPGVYRKAFKSRETIWQEVGDTLAKYGFRWVRAPLPHKTLAVRSGLARYGRNNISYIEGLGNFHRLLAFYTDMPCDEDSWQEPRMLDLCERCHGCECTCPTGAIVGDRFLIHAERCVTFYNEKDLDVDFPDWFKPEWHTCLAGCIECQKHCPENKQALRYVEGEGFDESETALFLKGVKAEELPIPTREKMERNDMLTVLDVLPRNLKVLLP
jgi:epoxyqueuosine reductase